ncbi:MAG: transposase [Candidatus Aureabacteria bacterium]|nr:transposase [Candidatus Auribacterota bacterium]
MPRIGRIVAPGLPHHITQRGNYRQTVFSKDFEYTGYLRWLDEYTRKYKIDILAYCLMPNHVHFICVPHRVDSLARSFNACHMRYAQYFNKKNCLRGHLWQGRFYSCILDEQHLYASCRYVENNPVRAKLVRKAENWQWSSAKAHLNKGTGSISLADIKEYMEVNNWREYLSEKEDKTLVEKIRSGTLSGKPLGDSSFIQQLEKVLGKKLRTSPRGRPRKKQEK